MHHDRIRQVDDPVVFEYNPSTSESDGRSGQFCRRKGWDLFFDGDDELLEAPFTDTDSRMPSSVLGIMNQLRKEREPPKAKMVEQEVERRIAILKDELNPLKR